MNNLMQEHWDTFLKMGRECLQEDKDMDPAALLIKEDSPAGNIVIFKGVQNGQDVEQALKMSVTAFSPNYFIFHMLGWGAEEKAYKRYNPKKISDMPLDDRSEIFIQLMVTKDGQIKRSCLGKVKRIREEISIEEEDFKFIDHRDGLTSRFVFGW